MGEIPTAPEFGADGDHYRAFEVADGTMVIYDPDNPEAWIRSTAFTDSQD